MNEEVRLNDGKKEIDFASLFAKRYGLMPVLVEAEDLYDVKLNEARKSPLVNLAFIPAESSEGKAMKGSAPFWSELFER